VIDLAPAIARENLMRVILLYTYPGEASRGAKWARMRP